MGTPELFSSRRRRPPEPPDRPQEGQVETREDTIENRIEAAQDALGGSSDREPWRPLHDLFGFIGGLFDRGPESRYIMPVPDDPINPTREGTNYIIYEDGERQGVFRDPDGNELVRERPSREDHRRFEQWDSHTDRVLERAREGGEGPSHRIDIMRMVKDPFDADWISLNHRYSGNQESETPDTINIDQEEPR